MSSGASDNNQPPQDGGGSSSGQDTGGEGMPPSNALVIALATLAIAYQGTSVRTKGQVLDTRARGMPYI
jgi:hypothetical protein